MKPERIRHLATLATDEELEKFIASIRNIANYVQRQKSNLVKTLYKEGQNFYYELTPYNDLLDVVSNITPEDLRPILIRMAKEAPPPVPPLLPTPKTNKELFDDVMDSLRRVKGKGWNSHKQ